MTPPARQSRRRRVFWACAAVLVLLTAFVYVRIRPALLVGDLMQAVSENNLAKANAALHEGANVNGIISRDRILDTMEAFAGRCLDDVDRTTPLLLATVECHDEMVRLLVEHGANVNDTGYGDYTPLMFAAEKCNVQTIQYLIDKGANVNAVTGDDGTPLLAFARKRPAIQALLIKAGAKDRDRLAH